MNYKIILNENKFDEFINWLPETKDSECFYIQLFGRRKYTKIPLQQGEQSLARFVCKKEQIKYKIRQLETQLGTYRNRSIELPQECLALYITPNPRCHEKAAKQLLKVLADRITKPYENYNLHNLTMTELHKSIGTKYYIDFDFDNINFTDIKDKLFSYINKEALTVIKTRGGFHLLVKIANVNKEFTKTWYNNISSLGIDAKGKDLLNFVGCVQGDFIPHFLEI